MQSLSQARRSNTSSKEAGGCKQLTHTLQQNPRGGGHKAAPGLGLPTRAVPKVSP